MNIAVGVAFAAAADPPLLCKPLRRDAVAGYRFFITPRFSSRLS